MHNGKDMIAHVFILAPIYQIYMNIIGTCFEYKGIKCETGNAIKLKGKTDTYFPGPKLWSFKVVIPCRFIVDLECLAKADNRDLRVYTHPRQKLKMNLLN